MPHLLMMSWSQCVLLGLPPSASWFWLQSWLPQPRQETWPGGPPLRPSPRPQMVCSLPRSPGKCPGRGACGPTSLGLTALLVRTHGLLFSPRCLPCHCHPCFLVHLGTKPCLPSMRGGRYLRGDSMLPFSHLRIKSNSSLKDLTCDTQKI